MKAFMIITFVMMQAPFLPHVKVMNYESRKVCEIDEGRLMQPVTSLAYWGEYKSITIKGVEMRLKSAECYDMPCLEECGDQADFNSSSPIE